MANVRFELEKTINMLTDNLNVLVREAQILTDRENLLEKKLKLAYEQYQLLAKKFAAVDPETTRTLECLAIHPRDPSIENLDVDPSLSNRRSTLKITDVIEDIRLAVKELRNFVHKPNGSNISVSTSTGNTFPVKSERKVDPSEKGSQNIVHEEDSTAFGIKSPLGCPFSIQTMKPESENCNKSQLRVNTKPTASTEFVNSAHGQQGPLISACYSGEERKPCPAKSSPKCPIRLLGEHSPEEIAQYFETHKHEIPRSHEICVKRHQRNDYLIRKLDAKYGNLVSVIEGLGQKHQPLLPENEEIISARNISNERLERWAKNVSVDESSPEAEQNSSQKSDDRESRFNRSMKEIRVGESPSRPWGIPVPESRPLNNHILKSSGAGPTSPILQARLSNHTPTGNRNMTENQCEKSPAGNPLFQKQSTSFDKVQLPCQDDPDVSCPFNSNTIQETCCPKQPISPVKETERNFSDTPHFLKATGAQMSRMIFTGPVFIGYPTEEAIKIFHHSNRI
ncbi:hypothetical protein GcC1_061017 [Golovinomyces cichoracearum]|uniref:Uncharacterized protein n=1 Tax=Golovinomyces cichoracearum TaxID=62708 RepID=A0A420ISZ3_9PEZI|nr:hypothetical protein GcC1_061017 [Golovinomyces cichoracearum]